MPTAQRSAATRLLVVVAVVVLAMLVAPLADVAPQARAQQSAPAAPAAGTGTAAHVDAVKAKRKVKKTKKKVRKTRRVASAPRAAAATTPTAVTAWSTPTLTYYDGLPSQWAWSLRTAAEEWNASGIDLTLVPVSDPAVAQVKVGYGDIGGSSGLATVGETSGAFVKLSDRYRTAAGDQYDRVEVLGVLTHELGHVLGLEHVPTSCALMGPVMDIAGCGIFEVARPDAYRCDVVGDAAVASAVRLYGGSARPRAAGQCAVDAPLGTPAADAAAPSESATAS